MKEFITYEPENGVTPESREHGVYVILREDSILHDILLPYDEITNGNGETVNVYVPNSWDGKFFIPDPVTGWCDSEHGGKDISSEVIMFSEEHFT